MTLKANDVILRTVTKVAVFIILTYGVHLFLAGHYEPGGGFVGGLVLSSAFVLMYLAFDIETVQRGMPIDFKMVAGAGAFLSVATGTASIALGVPFLTQEEVHLPLPILGDVAFASVLLFEAGVALAVIGTVITIILSISEDV